MSVVIGASLSKPHITVVCYIVCPSVACCLPNYLLCKNEQDVVGIDNITLYILYLHPQCRLAILIILTYLPLFVHAASAYLTMLL